MKPLSRAHRAATWVARAKGPRRNGLRHRDGLGDGVQARTKYAALVGGLSGLKNALHIVPDGISAAGDHRETHLLILKKKSWPKRLFLRAPELQRSELFFGLAAVTS